MKTISPSDKNVWPFFEQYQETCANPPSPLSASQFSQYVSLCQPGLHCPSAYQQVISRPDAGFYSERAISQFLCPVGSFCPQGVKQPCPVGFICPSSVCSLFFCLSPPLDLPAAAVHHCRC